MKRFACADGSTLNYNIVGSGTPIVFVHGWGVDLHLWMNKVEALPGPWKRRYRRVYFDLPGMGRSVASAAVRCSDQVLDRIEEFVDFALPGASYLLAGESYGGYVARGLLGRHRARLRGLFLLCPLVVPGWRRGSVPPHEVLVRDDAFLRSLGQAERDSFGYLSVVQTKPMWRDFKRDIRLEAMPENAGFLESRLDGAFSPAIDLDFPPFDKPTAILLGRQDTEVGFRDQYELYRDYPRASIHILDLAGHNLQIERRPLFNASFLDWLERVELDAAAPGGGR